MQLLMRSGRPQSIGDLEKAAVGNEEADAIATQAGVPKHMNLGLVQMKDQECMDRCPAAIFIFALL